MLKEVEFLRECKTDHPNGPTSVFSVDPASSKAKYRQITERSSALSVIRRRTMETTGKKSAQIYIFRGKLRCTCGVLAVMCEKGVFQ